MTQRSSIGIWISGSEDAGQERAQERQHIATKRFVGFLYMIAVGMSDYGCAGTRMAALVASSGTTETRWLAAVPHH